MGVWDNVTVESNSFITFDKVGEEVVGKVLELSTKEWPPNDKGVVKVDPQLKLLVEEDGEAVEKILTAGTNDLKSKLIENPPNEGDVVRIKYTHKKSLPGGKAAKFHDYEIVEKAAPKSAPFLKS
jgi:hypothetical protein